MHDYTQWIIQKNICTAAQAFCSPDKLTLQINHHHITEREVDTKGRKTNKIGGY